MKKVGSPYYAAPEQEVDPDNVGYEADIFSVGVILYRMLTGHLPGQDSSAKIAPPSKFTPTLQRREGFRGKASRAKT
jgi:eukaryotic-like serine/threonine-protein kinase